MPGSRPRQFVTVGQTFGSATVAVADVPLVYPGGFRCRGALLTCSCSDVLFAAPIRDLLRGKIRSCGHLSRGGTVLERRLRRAGV
jgi:hypothetical protein